MDRRLAIQAIAAYLLTASARLRSGSQPSPPELSLLISLTTEDQSAALALLREIDGRWREEYAIPLTELLLMRDRVGEMQPALADAAADVLTRRTQMSFGRD